VLGAFAEPVASELRSAPFWQSHPQNPQAPTPELTSKPAICCTPLAPEFSPGLSPPQRIDGPPIHAPVPPHGRLRLRAPPPGYGLRALHHPRHGGGDLPGESKAQAAQRLIRSGAKRLWVALDGDKAGQAATSRLIEGLRPLAITGQLDLLVVALPPGEDPDSLVRRDGAQGLQHHLAQARHWLAWELDRLLEDLEADPNDLSTLQRCERQGSELLAQLPEGVLRQKAEQRLLEALGVVPQGKGPGKGAVVLPVEGRANGLQGHQEAVPLAERRALRLFLCCPSLREVLSVLVLSDPLHREAMGWLWCLSRRLGENASGAEGDGLRAAVLAALPQMDAPLAGLLRPLVGCGEAVRRRLEAHPEGELMCILDVLEPVG
jgi:hypothetical protein